MIRVFAIAKFIPHGMCYLWQPWLVGLHLIGDGLIALSYFSIPVTILYILRQRQDIPFNKIFILFAAFILFCGAGHAFNVWTLWHPQYWVSGWLRLATALVSLATAIALIRERANILKLPSPTQINEINRQLQAQISKLQEQEATIRQQEEFLRSIYENVREAIFVVDVEKDGTFRYQDFNPAAVKLTGIAEVRGKTPTQILPSEAAAAVETRYRQCIEEKITISYEESLPFQGENTWWMTTLNPVANSTGEIYRIIGTSLNINERKRVETELDRDKNFLEALLDNLSDGIVACDRDGHLTLFNQATKEFHGLPQKPIPAEQWAQYYNLYLPDGKTMMSREEVPLFRALQGELVRDVEMAIVPHQGKPRVLLANGNPIVDRDGNKIGAIAAMRDMTELKKVERDLARLNSELESRVQKRTAQLEQLNAILLATTASLEQKNAELDRFAYVTSHDLKAPLRAIANLAEWLEEDLADKLDEDTKYNMNLLQGRVRRLENLINGLLAYSRVGRLEYQSELVDVGQMIAEIIDLLDIPPNFDIKTQGEMPVFTTKAIPLQQVLNNLISNALKHSESDRGMVTISVKELDEYYEFSVADNGKGIDPQYHERIFDIFQTLEARDTKESTGMGLSIVKKAVESQGGKVTVESEIGKGCIFGFTWKK